jgi:carboxyl-terminal processing protease
MAIIVAKVFNNTPAERGGLQVNDAILAIDGEGVTTLTPEQAIERLRGGVGSEVVLTILRPGQELPFEKRLTRETIQVQSLQQ